MKNNSMIAMLVLMLLIVTHSPCWCAEIGDPLPDFIIQTFDGQPLSRSIILGRPSLLVFWNTWCVECKRDLPKINRMAKEFGPKGLVVLAINTGLNDSESKARDYWKKFGYIFPTGYDYSFDIRKVFEVRGVPTVFLVDTKGIVRYKSPTPPENMGEQFKMLNIK